MASRPRQVQRDELCSEPHDRTAAPTAMGTKGVNARHTTIMRRTPRGMIAGGLSKMLMGGAAKHLFERRFEQ